MFPQLLERNGLVNRTRFGLQPGNKPDLLGLCDFLRAPI